jgi:pimeloyl-ACP methyl ester carboxylesterase
VIVNLPYSNEIHYRGSLPRGTSRDVLILIHGAGGSYLFWPPDIRHLSVGGILAIDLPGHGESSGDCEDAIEAYAHTLLKFMDRLEIEQAVLGGLSMGGAIAQQMCLDYPERVNGLILVSTGAKLRVYPQLIEDCRRLETYPQAVSQILEWSFSQHADQKLVSLAGERMKEVSPRVLLSDFEACNAFDIRDSVGDIKQPTLIISGEDDQMTPVKFSEYLAEKINGSRLEIIPEAGHMVMLEKPLVVAGLIDKFLGELAR